MAKHAVPVAALPAVRALQAPISRQTQVQAARSGQTSQHLPLPPFVTEPAKAHAKAPKVPGLDPQDAPAPAVPQANLAPLPPLPTGASDKAINLDAAAPVDAGSTTPRPAHALHAMPHHLPVFMAKAAAHAGQEDRVELMLDPAELGRVRFELTPSADRIQVNVSVERPETLDLLRRNIDSLRAEFRDAGFDAATLSFSQWGKGQDARPETQGPKTHLGAAPLDTPAPPDPKPARNSSRHGLDLRL